MQDNEKLHNELTTAENKINEFEMERQIQNDRESEAKENDMRSDISQASRTLTHENKSLEERDVNSQSACSATSFTSEDAKVLLYNIKKREKEQKRREAELREENDDLRFQLEKMQTISNYEGHSNPGQKIKHLLKIKEENNQLKKEL